MAASPDKPEDAVISRVTRADSAAFEALVAIYRASIERSEQKPVETLARAVDDPRYRFLVARRGDDVTGFAISYTPAPGNVWLLEYMAVDARRRSGGVGAALLDATANLHRAAGREVGLLEVDAIDGDSQQRVQQERRLAFYARHGCRVVEGLNYVLPLPGAPPMHLLALAPKSVTAIAKPKLLDWISAIYREVYAMPADDPRPTLMVAPLPDPVRLSGIEEAPSHA